MVSDPKAKTERPAHAVLAVVLQVRDGRLQVLLWERALEPFRGSWSLPGGDARRGRDARAVDPPPPRDARSTSASSPTSSSSRRAASPDRNPERWELATAYLGLVPSDVDPGLPDDTRWHPVDELPQLAFDHGRSCSPAASGCAPSSRTRTSASRSRPTSSRSPSCATSTAPRSATTSRRRTSSACSLRRHLLVPTGSRREPGPAGGRPAALFGFAHRELEITDQFAVLRPPGSG